MRGPGKFRGRERRKKPLDTKSKFKLSYEEDTQMEVPGYGRWHATGQGWSEKCESFSAAPFRECDTQAGPQAWNGSGLPSGSLYEKPAVVTGNYA